MFPRDEIQHFLCRKSAIYFGVTFEHLAMCDTGYIDCPTALEWDRAKRLCQFLGSFYNLICLFSSIKYPTSQLFFSHLILVYNSIKVGCESQDESLRRMTFRKNEKFKTYWSKFNKTLAIVAVLDPRYKFEFMQWAYRKLYGDEARSYISKVRKRLRDLFEEYFQRSNSYSSSSVFTSNDSGHVESQEAEIQMILT